MPLVKDDAFVLALRNIANHGDTDIFLSLFRSAKYRPEFPTNGFAELEAIRSWVDQFVCSYN
jgi:hypothetical protein